MRIRRMTTTNSGGYPLYAGRHGGNNAMAHRALRQRAAALHVDNAELWSARISAEGGPWFQLVHPQVQHLVHSSALPAEMNMGDGDDDDDYQSDDTIKVAMHPSPPPRLYHEKAVREGFQDDAHYWLHLAHDDSSAIEMVFDMPLHMLREDCANPLRWRVGSPRPCVVQLVMRLPTTHDVHRCDETVLMNFEFSMDFAAYASDGKPHHYSMVLLAGDHTAEMEFHSRLDTETRSGFYYHPTRFTLQIRTDVLPLMMATHNQWFKKYMQGLGVLPEGP